ncbi:MAG: hypothetical protein C4334_08575 [Pyrinomonas sp.]|uniref:glycosyltransferase n=1 Tax=Pyrinomonas sp. TaxID=2080306 RepID=UPI0033275A6A
MSLRTLYVCYFGLREPLVQTQVVPYLGELARRGVEPHLMTFEPNEKENWTSDEVKKWKDHLRSIGIQWISLPYHKSPSLPATIFDIVAGARKVVQLTCQRSIDVIHARSHVPMAMVLLSGAGSRCQTIFDIRGLLAEEYADAGIWSVDGAVFKMVKKIEEMGIRRADHVIVLTERLREWLIQNKGVSNDKITVIPCCVDLSKYEVGLEENARGEFKVVYAGSVTGLYLLEEMGRFFLALKRKVAEAKLQILTKESAENVKKVLRSVGVAERDFEVASAQPSDIPGHLCRASLGISFRKPTFSQIAASPTKIPEYLAAGLPVVSNAGIGDTDLIVERERVGVVLDDFTESSYERAVDRALALVEEPEVRERCRSVARAYFDLQEVGGRRYYDVYEMLAAGEMPRATFPLSSGRKRSRADRFKR